MKRGIRLGVGLAACVAMGAVAQEQEPAAPAGVEVSAEGAVLSSYVWRGQVLNDEAVLQPSLTVGKGGFTFNVWANIDLTERYTDDVPECSEVDFLVSYARTFGAVTVEAGMQEFLFPHQTLTETEDPGDGTPPVETVSAYPGTRELFVSASLEDLPVVPSVALYYDFDEAQGLYAVLGATYTLGVNDWLDLDFSGSLGAATDRYNDYYFGDDSVAFNDATLGVAANVAVGEALTLSPSVQYAWLVDDSIRAGATDLYGEKDRLVIGATASYTF